MSMINLIIRHQKSWLAHMQLDEKGHDPPGIKLRPAQGIMAADYFIGSYWVWAKAIKLLSKLGYDNTSLYMASYDWRLGFGDLEIRDGYYSQLKSQIEFLHKRNNEKVVIAAHSMGSLVTLYFLQWINNTDKSWIGNHLESFVNIAGPLLGVPKSISAILSGEMKDTVQQPLGADALNRFISRDDLAHVFRSWGGLAAMLPKGGEAVWGSETISPLDAQGPMIRFEGKDLYWEQAHYLLQEVAGDKWTQNIYNKNNYGHTSKKFDEKCWANPLLSPLPNIPVFCLYGIGKETERGYVYLANRIFADAEDIKGGVLLADGDATVPTLSLGFMGATAWRHPQWNPHGARIVVREYHDMCDSHAERGGPRTADHVDILGNTELLVVLNL